MELSGLLCTSVLKLALTTQMHNTDSSLKHQETFFLTAQKKGERKEKETKNADKIKQNKVKSNKMK